METKEQFITALKEAQAKIKQLEERGGDGEKIEKLEARIAELEKKLEKKASDNGWGDW